MELYLHDTFWTLGRIGVHDITSMRKKRQESIDLSGLAKNPLLRFTLKYPNACVTSLGVLSIGTCLIAALLVSIIFCPPIVFPAVCVGALIGYGAYYAGCGFYAKKVRPLLELHDAQCFKQNLPPSPGG